MSSSCFNLILDVQFACDMLVLMPCKSIIWAWPDSCLPPQLHLENTLSCLLSALASIKRTCRFPSEDFWTYCSPGLTYLWADSFFEKFQIKHLFGRKHFLASFLRSGLPVTYCQGPIAFFACMHVREGGNWGPATLATPLRFLVD